MTASTFIDVNGCARCDADGHPRLEFRRLERPVVVAGVELTHWAPCPNTGEPILMAEFNEDTPGALGRVEPHVSKPPAPPDNPSNRTKF